MRRLGGMLLILLCLFTGLGGAESESLQFWTALSGSELMQMQKLLDLYNAEHPSRPVSHQNFSTSGDLLKALKEQEPPDLALIESHWIDVLKPKLYPADEVLSQVGSMVRAVAEADTFKAVWQACVREDKTYAIPFSAETAALVLNGRHFKKSLRISTFKQWEKLTPANGKIWKGVFPFHWSPEELGRLWVGFAQSLAGKPKDKNDRPLNLHDEAAALNLWWGWANRLRITPIEVPSLPDHFPDGAVWILRPREVEGLKGKFYVQPLPKANRSWPYLRVQALAFFQASRRDRGWELANFLTDYAQLKFWSMSTPTVPVNKQVYLSPDYLQDVDARRPWLRTYIAAAGGKPAALRQLSLEQLEGVGEIVVKTLRKEMQVQQAALKIHGLIFERGISAKGWLAPLMRIPPPSQRSLEEAEKKIVGLLRASPGEYSLFFFVLDGTHHFEYWASRPIPAASVIKLPLLCAVFRLARKGKISLEERIPLEERHKVPGSGVLRNQPAGSLHALGKLAEWMITRSDNTATDLLIRRLGMTEINRSFKEDLDLRATKLEATMREVLDGTKTGRNVTTAKEMGKVLVLLYRRALRAGEAGSDSRRMLAILKRQENRRMIPRYLPSSIAVAHKTGELSGVAHDAALVYHPLSPYVLVIMSQNVPNKEARDLIARVSLILFTALSRKTSAWPEVPKCA